MDKELINRKGARKAQDIPKQVLELLNVGKIETVNLTEWLAVDHLKLIETNFTEIGISEENTKLISEKIKSQKNSLQTIILGYAKLYGWLYVLKLMKI